MWLGNFIAWFLKFLYGGTFHERYYDGEVWLVNRIFPSWAAGQTWGKYIFIRSDHWKNKDLVRHEYVHVVQWQKWSVLFLPAYVGASIWAFFRYGRKQAYYMNYFERQARGE